jgi:hypothetical protein
VAVAGRGKRSETTVCICREFPVAGSPAELRPANVNPAREQGRRPLSLVITAGQHGDSPQCTTVLDRIRVKPPVRDGQGVARTGCWPTRRTPGGHAFIGQRLYLPEHWTKVPDRCRQAGVPKDVVFATKPHQAVELFAEVEDAGVPFGWLAGDGVVRAHSDDPPQRERSRRGGLLPGPRPDRDCDDRDARGRRAAWPRPPDPERAAALSKVGIAAVLRCNRRRDVDAKAERIQTALRGPALRQPAAVTRAYAVIVAPRPGC